MKTQIVKTRNSVRILLPPDSTSLEFDGYFCWFEASGKGSSKWMVLVQQKQHNTFHFILTTSIYGCGYHYYLPFTYERDVKVLSKITQLMSGGCRRGTLIPESVSFATSVLAWLGVWRWEAKGSLESGATLNRIESNSRFWKGSQTIIWSFLMCDILIVY